MIEFSISFLIFFLSTFFAMEFAAWALHKYVMHGFLWWLHEDHHVINKKRWWQLNDAFAIFFAVPSFFSILFSALYRLPLLGAFGFGIMAYGIAYFFVHEIIIHRRVEIKALNKGIYIQGVKRAHHVHHSIRTQNGAKNFGMLIVPLIYFTKNPPLR